VTNLRPSSDQNKGDPGARASARRVSLSCIASILFPHLPEWLFLSTLIETVG
jgi:hypothetical protein